MTVHQHIEATKRDAAAEAMKKHLLAAIDIADSHPGGQRALGECLCLALDTVCQGAPQYQSFGNVRDDATWWADTATPVELEIYTAAALRRITQATFAERARKRVLWHLWQTLPEDVQKAFLAKVVQEAPP